MVYPCCKEWPRELRVYTRKDVSEGNFVDLDLVQAHAWAAQSESNKHPEASLLKEEIEQDLSETKFVKHEEFLLAGRLNNLLQLILPTLIVEFRLCTQEQKI